GLAFSGSKLGKYSWANLMKKGVSYEPARDREELAICARLAAERAAAADVDARDEAGSRSEQAADRLAALRSGEPASGSSEGAVRSGAAERDAGRGPEGSAPSALTDGQANGGGIGGAAGQHSGIDQRT